MWRGHILHKTLVGHHFKLGVWLGGMLVVPSEEATYFRTQSGEWRVRQWKRACAVTVTD